MLWHADIPASTDRRVFGILIAGALDKESEDTLLLLADIIIKFNPDSDISLSGTYTVSQSALSNRLYQCAKLILLQFESSHWKIVNICQISQEIVNICHIEQEIANICYILQETVRQSSGRTESSSQHYNLHSFGDSSFKLNLSKISDKAKTEPESTPCDVSITILSGIHQKSFCWAWNT